MGGYCCPFISLVFFFQKATFIRMADFFGLQYFTPSFFYFSIRFGLGENWFFRSSDIFCALMMESGCDFFRLLGRV